MVDKIILSNVTTFQNDTTAINTINNNNSALTTAFDNTLSRDGTSPNQMGSNLDMNSFNIINLPPPATINSPARLADVVTNPTITVPPTGTSGPVVGLLNGNNTYSGTSTFTNTVTLPNNTVSNSMLAQMPANTVKGNSTGITANASDLTVSSFLTYLQSQNNTAGSLGWYNTNNSSTINLFGNPLFQVIAGGINQNALIGQAIQNQSLAGFATGVTGYGLLTNAGNQAFGVFGRADTTVAGGVQNEFDVNNNSANDAPTTTPINNTFGTTSTWPVGLFIAAGGSKRSYAGLYMTGVPGASNQFQYGIYMDKAVINTTGILLDADATHSPVNSLIVKNTGLSTNIPVIVQTLGTLNSTQPVVQLQNLSAGSIWEVHQDGSMIGTGGWSTTQNVNSTLPITVTNSNSGATASAQFQAISNAGTLSFGAVSTGAASASFFRWTGGGSTLIDALNATGNIALRTGSTPTNAIAIDASQNCVFTNSIALGAPLTKTTNYTQLATDSFLIFNGAGSITLTLLSAASFPGKILWVRTIAAQTVVSASSNVVPRIGGAAGTAILAASAGNWAMLVSDGTNWQIMNGT